MLSNLDMPHAVCIDAQLLPAPCRETSMNATSGKATVGGQAMAALTLQSFYLFLSIIEERHACRAHSASSLQQVSTAHISCFCYMGTCKPLHVIPHAMLHLGNQLCLASNYKDP